MMDIVLNNYGYINITVRVGIPFRVRTKHHNLWLHVETRADNLLVSTNESKSLVKA